MSASDALHDLAALAHALNLGPFGEPYLSDSSAKSRMKASMRLSRVDSARLANGMPFCSRYSRSRTIHNVSIVSSISHVLMAGQAIIDGRNALRRGIPASPPEIIPLISG